MNKICRILHVVPNMHSAGLENLLMNLYRNVDRNRIQFDFLVHYNEEFYFDKEIEKMGGKIYRLSFRNDKNIIKYLKDLNCFFKKNKYDIVHGHMASTAFLYLGIAKINKIPIRILHSHNSSTERNLKGILKRFMLYISKVFATDYFACGEKAGKFLFGKKKFKIIHNAIDLNKFYKDIKIKKKTREIYGIEDDAFIIGHIGRFNSQKNHKFLIDVFEKYHKANEKALLVLVGEGELENSIKKIVKEKGLEQYVKFLGIVENTNDMYNMFDIFLLPSIFEGLPVVSIESQAAECYMIASDTITEEICITSNVERLPINLDTSINEWVERVIFFKANNKLDEENLMEKFIKSGYEIKKEANDLMNYYIEIINKRGIYNGSLY